MAAAVASPRSTWSATVRRPAGEVGRGRAVVATEAVGGGPQLGREGARRER